MLVVNDQAPLYLRRMAQVKPKKRKGDPARGAQFKAFLVPKVEAMRTTMERFTADIGLTKAAATGWFATGSIAVGTIFSIQEKHGIPVAELLQALGYSVGESGSPAATPALSPDARRLVELIAEADASPSASGTLKHLLGLVSELLGRTPPKAKPKLSERLASIAMPAHYDSAPADVKKAVDLLLDPKQASKAPAVASLVIKQYARH